MRINNLKIYNKYKFIELILNKYSQIYIFNYDFLSSKESILLRNELHKLNLTYSNINTSIIQKMFNLDNLSNIKNFLSGNIIIVYSNTSFDKNIFETQIYKKLSKISKLILLGIIWDKKIYKLNRIKKYFDLQKKNKVIFYTPIFSNLNTLRKVLGSVRINN